MAALSSNHHPAHNSFFSSTAKNNPDPLISISDIQDLLFPPDEILDNPALSTEDLPKMYFPVPSMNSRDYHNPGYTHEDMSPYHGAPHPQYNYAPSYHNHPDLPFAPNVLPPLNVNVPVSPTLSPPSMASPATNGQYTPPYNYTPPQSQMNTPTTFSPPLGGSGDVKVKKADMEKWYSFNSPMRHYRELCDRNRCSLSNSINMRIRLTSEAMEFSAVDDAWIIYRQNQFLLEIDFLGEPLSSYSTDDNDIYYVSNQQHLLPVEKLYFHLYAIKHLRGQQIHHEETTELTQASRANAKKDASPPVPTAITNGRGTFSKVQFKLATLNNAKQKQSQTPQANSNQQFARLVISLIAQVPGNNYEFITSKISPPFIVRGQNPDKFKKNAISVESPMAPPMTPQNLPPTPQNTTTISALTQKELASRESTKGRKRGHEDPVMIKTEAVESLNPRASGWSKKGGVVYTNDKVGVGTATPQEALHVQGNILYTGELLKPSDQRIKSNIQQVDTTSSLATIEKIKIYDYELTHNKTEDTSEPSKERGVLAQELQQILPGATRVLKDVYLPDGTHMPELVVVQDRALLFENIGATKELGSIVKKDQEKIRHIGNTFETHIKEGSEAANHTLSAAGRLLDFILAEKQDVSNDHTNICCFMLVHSEKGFYGSLFGLGPAWTLYLLGFFFPPLWFFGALFIFSSVKSKKFAGGLHFFTLLLWSIFIAFIVINPQLPLSLKLPLPFFVMVLGLVGLVFIGLSWRWKRNQNISMIQNSVQREAQSQRTSLLNPKGTRHVRLEEEDEAEPRIPAPGRAVLEDERHEEELDTTHLRPKQQPGPKMVRMDYQAPPPASSTSTRTITTTTTTTTSSTSSTLSSLPPMKKDIDPKIALSGKEELFAPRMTSIPVDTYA